MQTQDAQSELLNRTRWDEIRFHYFCRGLYDKRRELMDATSAVEAVCQLTDLEPLEMVKLTAKTLTQYDLVPNQKEVLYLSKQMGYSISRIAKLIKTTPRNVCYLTNSIPDFAVYCRHTTREQTQIKKFMETVDFIKGCII